MFSRRQKQALRYIAVFQLAAALAISAPPAPSHALDFRATATAEAKHTQRVIDGVTAFAPFFFGYVVSGSSQYQIQKSLRLRASASAYLNRTLPGTITDRKKFTIVIEFKRGSLGTQQVLLNVNGSSSNYAVLQFDVTTDQLNWHEYGAGGYNFRRTTTRVFRDPNAHMQVVLNFDSTNATAADRAKIEINGVRETSFTSTDPTLNYDSLFNVASAVQNLGRFTSGSSHFDGLISNIHYIDGQALSASNFGQFDTTTGEWISKAFSGTYGLGGGRWLFNDNSAATAAAIGADSSGNGNNWTPNNISVIAGVTNDSLVDTPTNYGTDTGLGGEVRGNYCTLNPLDKYSSIAPVDGNLSSGVIPGAVCTIRGTYGMQTGKHYFEWLVSAAGIRLHVGIGNGLVSLSSYPGNTGDSNGFSWYGGGAQLIYNNATTLTVSKAPATNDIMGIAFDADTLKVWVRFNGGAWEGGGNPVTGTTPTLTLTAPGPYFPTAGNTSTTGSQSLVLNAGQRAYGATAPTGFKSLCTQNLPDPSIKKSSNGFAIVTDTGANVQATLAAARAGWTDYIEIFKRREATEGWRWRSSSDTGNYLDSSSTAAKTTFPTLSGTSYMGYAIRCDSGYPARSGLVTHTSGVASTVTHNLGNARCLIILKREDGISDWQVYHPDCTAGKVFYLNLTSGELTSATFASVGANSFQIGSVVTSGTYRYIVIAETDGFFKCVKRIGNASADGPYVNNNFRTRWTLFKNVSDGSTGIAMMDALRDPGNPVSNRISTEQATAENPLTSMFDFLSNGAKIRVNNGNNVSGNLLLSAEFAETPFKYARAR